MSKIKIEYQEGEDGMLYPLIQVSNNPNLKEEDLGKYGRMAMKYLKENHLYRHSELVLNGELLEVMFQVDEQAWEMMETLEKQMLELDPIRDPMNTYETYRHRERIRHQAEEVVLKDIVYVVR